MGSRPGSSSSSADDERTPLIPDLFRTQDGNPESSPKSRTQSSNVILLLCIVLVLIQCGDEIAQSPQARIAEAIFCFRHYEVTDPSKLLADRAHVGPGAIGGVAEELCKIEAVQSQLSSLRGYQTFFDGGPSLLLALPFGWAADKFGRRPLLFLGGLSFVLRTVWIQIVYWFWQSFDVRWVWASSLHGLMAGSGPVVSALLFVIVADVTPEEDRSRIFLRIGGVNLLSTVTMPLLSAWLMLYTPWIPSMIGTILQSCATVVIVAMPETLNYRQSASPIPTTPPTEVEQTPLETPPLNLPQPWLHELNNATSFLWADWRVPALVATFFIHLMLADSGPLQLQYVSTRYHLTFSEATTRLTIRAVANIALFFIVLPAISKLLRERWNLSGLRADLWMSRVSMACWALGLLLFGVAPTIATAAVGMGVMALGYGSMFLIRSFLTPLVPAHNVARLYSAISVVDTIGGMLGGPFLASLFNRGLEVGGFAVGLPFYFLGLACVCITVLLCVMGIRKCEEQVEMEEE
ncbi:hypothetical protein Q7P37_004275 [Cladosporium fusiforme]